MSTTVISPEVPRPKQSRWWPKPRNIKVADGSQTHGFVVTTPDTAPSQSDREINRVNWVQSEGPSKRMSIPRAFRVHWANLHEQRSGIPQAVFDSLVFEATTPRRIRGEQAPLSEAALDTFIALWMGIKSNAAAPLVSLTPAGGIVAEWVQNADRSLVVFCDREGKLAFSLFDSEIQLEDELAANQVAQAIAAVQRAAPQAFSWSER